MKKFINKTLKHLLLISIVYFIVIILMGNTNHLRHNLYYRIGSYGHMFTRLNELDSIVSTPKRKKTDILFLGSSHSYRVFDTRLFQKAGYNTFNLGSSFQTPIQTKYLIEKYIDSLNPGIVVIETYPESFCDNGTESTLDLLSNTDIDIELAKLILNHDDIIVYNTFLYSLYKDIFTNHKDNFVENPVKVNDTYITGGFVEKKIDYYKYKKYEKQRWNFNENQFDTFKEILIHLKKKNIKYILIQAPMTEALFNSYLNNDEFDKRMKTFGRYINLNNFMQLDDSLHFYDDDHLNSFGVKIVDDWVVEIIDES